MSDQTDNPLLEEKKVPPPADEPGPSAPVADPGQGGDASRSMYPNLPPPPLDGEPPQYYVAVSETPNLADVPPPPMYEPPEVQGSLPPGM